MGRLGLGLAALGACAGLACRAAAEPVVRITQILDYSSGKYGEQDSTEVTVLATTLKLSEGANFLRVSVPLLSITGPTNVNVVDRGVEGAGGPSRGTSRGLGDVSVSVGHSFNRINRTPAYLDLVGRVRAPTGDRSRGLGVGAVDVVTNAELGYDRRWGGAFVGAGRRFLGQPSNLKRRDGWQASTGFWINAAPKLLAGASYSWREASVRGFSDPSETYVYVSRQATRSLRIELNGTVGFSEGSPDYGIGLALAWRPQRPPRP